MNASCTNKLTLLVQANPVLYDKYAARYKAEPGSSTFKVLKYKYIQFWTNILKYIPSTLRMYLSTINSTFQLPSNFFTPIIKQVFNIKITY